MAQSPPHRQGRDTGRHRPRGRSRERDGGTTALAVRCGVAAVVGDRRRPFRRRLSRGDQPRRQPGARTPPGADDRASDILLLRSRTARLERPLARGGDARARLFPQALHHLGRDGGVGGRPRRHGARGAVRSLRPGLCAACVRERAPRLRRGCRLAARCGGATGRVGARVRPPAGRLLRGPPPPNAAARQPAHAPA